MCYTDWATFSIPYCTGHILCVLYRLGYLLNMLLYWPYSVCVTETGLPSQYVIVLAIFCVCYTDWATFSICYCTGHILCVLQRLGYLLNMLLYWPYSVCVIQTGLPSQYVIVLAIFCVCYTDWATFSICYCTGHILCVLYRLGYLLNMLLYWPYSVCVTETGLPSQYVIVLAIFCVCYRDWATFSIRYCTGHILRVLYRLGYLLNTLLYWPYSVCVIDTGLPSQYVIVLAIFCVSYRAWVTFSMSYCIHK